MKKLIFALLAAILIIFLFIFRARLKESVSVFLKEPVPAPKEVVDFKVQPVTGTSSLAAPISPEKLPDEINLNIPFVSQAPFSDWGMPYQEACEEAAAIMIQYYFENKQLDAKTMDEEILKLVAWQERTLGYYKDTTAAETARILREYFNRKNVEVIYDFKIEDIKEAVSRGQPVILLAAGRLLPNPNFRYPGPIYHAIVIKGYTKDGKIITNDPGTRKGKDFLYTPESLMNAAHEWNAENILKGRKAIVVVKD